MKFCTKCGSELPPDSAFCPRCGTPVAAAPPIVPPPAREEPVPTQEGPAPTREVPAPAPKTERAAWEDTQPAAASALYRLAEAHAQQDPTFRTTLAYTRLTAKSELAALSAQGYGTD